MRAHETKIDRLSNRALLLRVYDDGDTSVSSATGFVVETSIGPCLMTARHVVTGRHHYTGALNPGAFRPKRLTIMHRVKHEDAGTIQGFTKICEEHLFRDEDCTLPRWYEFPEYGRFMDFVFVPLTPDPDVHYCIVDTTPNKAEFSVQPANSDYPNNSVQIEPAHPVSVIGYPFGYFQGSGWPLWATGFIASEPAWNGRFRQQIIDCRSRQGQSGAPVYVKQFGQFRNVTGQDATCDGNVYCFLGLYSGRINDESDLGIVWTAETINEACNSLTIKNWAAKPDDSITGGPLPKI